MRRKLLSLHTHPSPMSFSGTLSEPENHCFIYRQPEKVFGLEENGLELYFRKMNLATQRQISEGKGQNRKTNYETFATELRRKALKTTFRLL